jgi:hypothetical protein
MCRLAKTRDFVRLLLSAIDEATFSGGIGETVKILPHREQVLVARKIPESLQDFWVGPERIFGAGAQFIEILIIKNLHSRIGLTLRMDSKQVEFLKYVDAAKEKKVVELIKTRIKALEAMDQTTVEKQAWFFLYLEISLFS